jgi:hypothetical protein
MLAEVGDIRRFRNIDYLSSYVGLVPSCIAVERKHIAGALLTEANGY